MNKIKRFLKQAFCFHHFYKDTQLELLWCPKCGESIFIDKENMLEFKEENFKFNYKLFD